MIFRPPFHLLQNEGYLIRSLLGAGLTDLRTANYADQRGRYYSGFFQLSIGLERLLKVVLIIDHMARNDLLPPNSQELRRFGHDLQLLLRAVTEHTAEAIQQALQPMVQDTMEQDILLFLNRFSKTARYHNLDSLGSGEQTTDPLAEWNGILLRVLEEKVSRRSKRRVERNASAVEALLEGSVHVTHRDLAGQSLSVREASLLTGMLELASRYVLVHVFRILALIADALEEATDRAHASNLRIDSTLAAVPYMREFVDFVYADEEYILRRKRWP